MSEYIAKVKRNLGLNKWLEIEQRAWLFARDLKIRHEDVEWQNKHHALMVRYTPIEKYDDYIWNQYLGYKNTFSNILLLEDKSALLLEDNSNILI